MKLADAEREMKRMLTSAMPVAQHERIAALCRPPERRTAMPRAGQVVWYRHEPFGALQPVEVLEVDISNPADTYVWRYAVDGNNWPVMVDGKHVMELVDDPWPDVYLKTSWGRIVTREARIEGSPGWLPMSSGGER